MNASAILSHYKWNLKLTVSRLDIFHTPVSHILLVAVVLFATRLLVIVARQDTHVHSASAWLVRKSCVCLALKCIFALRRVYTLYYSFPSFFQLLPAVRWCFCAWHWLSWEIKERFCFAAVHIHLCIFCVYVLDGCWLECCSPRTTQLCIILRKALVMHWLFSGKNNRVDTPHTTKRAWAYQNYKCSKVCCVISFMPIIRPDLEKTQRFHVITEW